MTDASNAASTLPHGVVNNTAKSRYEIDTAGVLSIADYVTQGDVITFTHTLTPPQLRGRGIAARLVHGAHVRIGWSARVCVRTETLVVTG